MIRSTSNAYTTCIHNYIQVLKKKVCSLSVHKKLKQRLYTRLKGYIFLWNWYNCDFKMNYSTFRYVRVWVFSLVYTSRIIVHVRLVAFFYRILNKISRKLDFSFILYYFQAYWCLMMSKTYVAITEEITNDHPLIANTINSHKGLLTNIRTSARPRWLYITTRANASKR